MKKMIITFILMYIVSPVAFADTQNGLHTDSVTAYYMDINIEALTTALGLNEDQVETVADFHTIFNKEMIIAGNAASDERETLVNYAVEKNTTNMSYILTKEQYDKYVMILNATLTNRGLK